MADGEYCCVCDRPVEGEPRRLGGRTYCDRHHLGLARENPAAARPILIAVGAAVLFAAVVAGLSALTGPTLDGPALVAVSLALSLVPAAIWLIAFYRQDRLEPEPKRYVGGVFLLGAILAVAIGEPIIRDGFQVGSWLYDSLLAGLLGSVFVIGFVQEFLTYAAIRYTVYNSPEFDERVDGIIYGAAAGLGYATALNIGYVMGNRGVDLGVGAVQVAITALAHASFSGVVGYFLGRAKFERMGPFWLPLGLSLAAVLNGIVSYATRELPQLGSFGYNAWYGLVLATIVAGGTFFVLFGQIRRLNAATLATIRTTS